MIITINNTIKNIFFVGDIHGSWNLITYQIRQYNIRNSVFIFCGDIGIGFEKLEHYTNNVIPELHKILKKHNNIFIWIAGNHDDPKYFENQIINTDYVKCVPNYTIVNVCDKNILCISGGISIDRSYRKQNDSVKIVNYMKWHNCDFNIADKNCIKSYWPDEYVKYRPKVEEHIDIICTHSAPSFCFPTDKGDIVTDFAAYDMELIKDINDERNTLDNIYEDYKDEITHWYYGHFHRSKTEIINTIQFKLLSIGEICKHYVSTDNNNIL
ncbi:metallophosphoesterase [Clostridium sp.]|uniref:metallophosphoesterase n=1 Tax=Clostridium sp. TaxID=1506 RepID=UPI002FC8795C